MKLPKFVILGLACQSLAQSKDLVSPDAIDGPEEEFSFYRCGAQQDFVSRGHSCPRIDVGALNLLSS